MVDEPNRSRLLGKHHEDKAQSCGDDLRSAVPFWLRIQPENLIIGKWQAGESGLKITAEFSKNGTAKLNMFGHTLRGTYKLDGDELEWTVNGKTTKSKAKVTTTEMELTSEGKTIAYKKI